MKQAGCILALIMILLFPFSVFAEAEITEVFFIPEQGFIRVKTQIPIPAGLEQVNFTLFPQAHITALWIPSLTGYEISRTGGKSVITVLFQPDNAAGFRIKLRRIYARLPTRSSRSKFNVVS